MRQSLEMPPVRVIDMKNDHNRGAGVFGRRALGASVRGWNTRQTRAALGRATLAGIIVLLLGCCAAGAWAQRSPAAQPSQVVVLVVRPHGFQPAQLTISKGRTFFSVHNRTGLNDISMQLDQERGPHLRTVALTRGKGAWREVVDLTPGAYVISVTENPRWVCRVTVTAR
jgi:hypothetical protein